MNVDMEAYIALGFLGAVIGVTAILFGYLLAKRFRR